MVILSLTTKRWFDTLKDCTKQNYIYKAYKQTVRDKIVQQDWGMFGLLLEENMSLAQYLG